jgi:transposase-like protein/rubredoxin
MDIPLIIILNKTKGGIPMSKIISLFINFLNRINKIIWKIIIFLSKFIKIDDINYLDNKPTNERYRHFKVDEPAFFEPFKTIETKDHKQLIKDNNIKPIKRRNGKNIAVNISCPSCNAPKDYLYDNTGKQIQFECKVCSLVFSTKPNPKKEIILKCPHCTYALSKRASRNDFDVYVCNNKKCSYYLNNLASLTLSDKKRFIKNPTLFKLHYIYRKFNIDLPTINKDYRDFIKSPIDISKAYSSQYIIGLCLTYHVNYGLSYRQTAALLRDIHEVYISYKTVENYCKSVSTIVHPVLEFYPYELSDTQAADETYIKVKGKTNYIFFYFDAINKIITSYRVFKKRDSLSSIKAAYSTLSKYDKIPDSLKVITDGNPIYKVACQYWTEHGLPFSLYQVIGLTNQDDISKEYRSEKQIIERHNRTLKYYYRPKGGFSSLDDANNYMVLFSTYFNFLRYHSSLGYKVPVEMPELDGISNMPNKWIELINLGYKYINIYG